MSYTMKKTDFIRECFYAVLSDGRPHRFGEILEFTQQQSKGTPFEGGINQRGVVQAYNSIIGYPDSEYERVRHGIYQKRNSDLEMQDVPNAKTQRSLSIEIQHTMIRDDSTLYPLLDSACELIDRMHTAFALFIEKVPEAKELTQPDYEKAAKSLDESIGSISSWIAHMEEIQNGMVAVKADEPTEEAEKLEETEDKVPVMQM